MRRKLTYSPHLGRMLLCFFMNLLFRWEGSVPAWILLIFHFVLGIPLFWFWIALGLWILIILIRTSLLSFAIRSSNEPVSYPKNKNPYSKGSQNEN